MPIENQELYTIEGAKILTAEGWTSPKSVVVEKGKIVEITTSGKVSGTVIPADGLFLLPGLIDIHGDGFEYHIAPRAGVTYPLDLAFMANDMALISAGITTFFYSLTDGFETGMRSRKMVRQILNVLAQNQAKMKAEIRIHIRHEQANIEDHEELIAWIKEKRIDLLSLNNHLPPIGDKKAFERYLAGYKRRNAGDTETAMEMIKGFQHRLPQGAEQVEELATLSVATGMNLASHDDMNTKDVDTALARGVNIAEFPMHLDLAQRFRSKGVHVLMGAPNVVRGGSHVSGVSAREAIAAGAVDVLCSDYHYPSLYRAPFLLEEEKILALPEAWQLVRANAAHATGMQEHKGQIAPGMDADFLLLSSLTGYAADIKAVIRDGRYVFVAG